MLCASCRVFCCNYQNKQSLEWRQWRLSKKLGFGAVLPKPLLCREQAPAKLHCGHGGLQAVLSFASQLGQTHHVMSYGCTQTIISEAQTSPWKHPPKPGSKRAEDLVSGVVSLLVHERAAGPKPPQWLPTINHRMVWVGRSASSNLAATGRDTFY